MSGARRPVNREQAIDNLLSLLSARGDGPCPTASEVMEVTGVAVRNVWDFVDGLRARGYIEFETRGRAPACCRRMRLPDGPWTGWTARRWARRLRRGRA